MAFKKHHSGLTQKSVILLASLLVILLLAISGTIAYLTQKTEPIENEFTPSKVACRVQETFKDGLKENVSIQNTGNIPAYIRAYVIANWVSVADGEIYAVAPVQGVDYSMEFLTNDWFRSSDGFWYYSKPVDPAEYTSVLIRSASQLTDAPAGYQLRLEIHAGAIQAEPVTTVQTQWGVTVTNGVLNP